MEKTKEGLAEEYPSQLYGIRQPYYKPTDEIIENGEFVIETVTPKIKILKHASSNTDLIWTDISEVHRNDSEVSKEIDKIIETPIEECREDVLFAKMQTLNECMSKFVDSSNNLNKVLTKKFDQKNSGNVTDRHYFNLGLGE